MLGSRPSAAVNPRPDGVIWFEPYICRIVIGRIYRRCRRVCLYLAFEKILAASNVEGDCRSTIHPERTSPAQGVKYSPQELLELCIIIGVVFGGYFQPSVRH